MVSVLYPLKILYLSRKKNSISLSCKSRNFEREESNWIADTFFRHFLKLAVSLVFIREWGQIHPFAREKGFKKAHSGANYVMNSVYREHRNWISLRVGTFCKWSAVLCKENPLLNFWDKCSRASHTKRTVLAYESNLQGSHNCILITRYEKKEFAKNALCMHSPFSWQT